MQLVFRPEDPAESLVVLEISKEALPHAWAAGMFIPNIVSDVCLHCSDSENFLHGMSSATREHFQSVGMTYLRQSDWYLTISHSYGDEMIIAGRGNANEMIQIGRIETPET